VFSGIVSLSSWVRPEEERVAIELASWAPGLPQAVDDQAISRAQYRS
jgi:hypothetical protein